MPLRHNVLGAQAQQEFALLARLKPDRRAFGAFTHETRQQQAFFGRVAFKPHGHGCLGVVAH